jgi:starch phosphorylase
MLMADYQAYIDCQQRVGQAYSDSDSWTRMSIFNALRMGGFSSDLLDSRVLPGDLASSPPSTVPLAERRQTKDGKGGELTCQLKCSNLGVSGQGSEGNQDTKFFFFFFYAAPALPS